MRELATLSIQLTALDDDGPAPFVLSQTNTLPGTPSNLISDNGDGTGTLNWTPAANDHLSSPFSITVTATDGEGLNVSEMFVVTVLPQGTGGTLNGAGAVMPSTVSLPNVGTTDWVHFGRNGVASNVNRKAGITPLITAAAPLPGTTPFASNNAFTDYSWFGGTPIPSDGVERNGLRAFADGLGYSFSVPAGLSTRTVKVYLGARNAIVGLTASLSDASAPDYSNIISATTGKIGRVVTLDYAAGLPGQTLNVTIAMVGAPLQSNGYLGFDAVTLVGSNLSPVITPIADQTIVENQPFTLAVTATDDGPVPLTLSATNTLPGNPSILTDNGGGSGTINYTPALGSAGAYNVAITATDFDGESSIETFSIIVAENTAPTLTDSPDTSAIEGQLLSFGITATDADGPAPLTLTATSNIPGNPNVLTDNGNGSGTINWIPASGLAGGSPYTITVTATDGDNLTDVDMFEVSLTASAPPVLAPIGNLTLIQNRVFALAISGSDPDGPPLAFSDTNNIGQSLISNDDGNGNANLVWIPATLGTFTETVILTDGTGTTDSETISITVVPNTPPTLNSIGNRTVIKNSSLFFTISATDPDSSSFVSFSQTNTLPGSPNILTDGNDGTATILWTTGDLVNDPGNPFSVTVTATDVDGGVSTETFTVEVTDSNAPVLTAIGDQNAVEQLPLNLQFTATDSDGPTPLVVSQTNNLPGSVSFTDNGNGSANFSWTPAVGDAAGAPYSVTVTVSDGGNTSTSETFAVGVTANASPELAPIGEQTAVENALFALNISASDDGTTPVAFSQTNTLPGSPSILTDNNDGTATLSYTAGLDERLNSPYSVTVTVTDENGTTDAETFVLNVVRGGRLTGAATVAASTVDLTNLGINDWVHWGLGGNSGLNRKTGVALAEQISDYTPINDANPQTFTIAQSTYTWSDGDPVQSSTNRSNLRVFDMDKGFSITLPASRSERLAHIFVGGANATGTLTATLSDSSAPLFQTTIVAGSKTSRDVALTYRSGSQNQTLTIEWVKSTSGGNIALEAVTLENLNEAPSVPAIGNQNAVENQLLSIPLVATDVDGPDPIVFSQSNNLPGLPDILTDNGDGTGSLDWTPAVGDAGSYQVTLTYTDDVGESDSQTFTISVAVNTPPTFTPINDVSITELESLSISVNSTDTDGPAPLVLTQTNDLPGTPNFVDNGDGTGLLTWMPNAGDSAQSPFTITFTATDGDGEVSNESLSVTLSPSLPPVLQTIGDQQIIEGRTLNVPLTATDPDPTGSATLIFSDTNTIGSSIVINNNALQWTPAPGNTGTFTETVTVTDNTGAFASETITITVLADQSPLITEPGPQTAFENAPYSLTIFASDPDGQVPVMLTQTNNLPGGPAFIDNGDNTATFTLNANAGDSAGAPYSITVTATDGFGNSAVRTISIDVQPSLPPVITPIADQVATEGELLSIQVISTDSDGPNPLVLTQTNTLPGSPDILSDNGDGTGTLNYTPNAGASFSGPYTVDVTATDGAGESSTESFQVTVTREGVLTLNSSINDGNEVDLTAEGEVDWIHWGLGGVANVDRKSGVTPLISNYSLTNGGNVSASTSLDALYTWTDGDPTASATRTRTGVRLFAINRGFQITAPAGLVERTLNFYVGIRASRGRITASLSDGSAAEVTELLIQNSGLTSRQVSITYTASQANEQLTVTFEKKLDTGFIAIESATLSSNNADPTFSPIGAQTLTEGVPFNLTLTAQDDGPAPILWTSTNTLPGNPQFLTDFGAGVAELDFTPAVGDAGSYNATVTVTDAALGTATETFPITVVANQVPTIVPMPDAGAVVGNLLTVNVVANDIDGPNFPILTQSNNIPGNPASFVDNGDGTGSLSWIPALGAQANSPYTVTLTADDTVNAPVQITFQIFVTASFPPDMQPAGPFNVIENRPLAATVAATDPDGSASITLSEANSTVGQSILTDNGNGNGAINWTPPLGSAGTYTLDVVATDTGGDSDFETVTIVVVANQAPVLGAIGSQTATESTAFALGFTAMDADGVTPPALTQTNTLPGSPTFVDNGDGTASLTWTPPANSSGTYSMTVTAADLDGASDFETFQVQVIASQPPVIDPIADQMAIETQEFTLQATANDPDGPAPIVWSETNDLPGTLNLTDNGDGSADLSYTPASGESLAGPYNVTLTATDGAGIADTESFTIEVNREGSISGTLETSPFVTDLTAEGSSDWTEWFDDNIIRKANVTPEQISNWTGLNGLDNNARPQSSLPAGALWSDGSPTTSSGRVNRGAKTFTNGHAFQFTVPAGIGTRQLRVYTSGRNTTGRLTASLSDGSSADFEQDVTHSGTQSNVFTLTYKASSANQTLTVTWAKVASNGWITLDAATLAENNASPEIAPIGAQTAVENQTLTINVSATDIDGPAPLVLTSSNTLPGNPVVFTDNGNGDGTITYTPAVGEAGNYTITVTATDAAGGIGTETFPVAVVVNQAPVLAAIGDQSTIAQQTLALVFQATDDGPSPLTITQTNTLPNAPAFTDNGDGTANFSWTPNAGASGSFTVTVTATDGDSMSATETFSIAVTASNPPVVTPITNQSIIEGRLLSFNVSANDADGNGTLSLAATPNTVPGLTFTDNGNGSGTVTMVPPIGSAGIYNLTITATDTGGDSDSESFSITVAANQPPTLTAIADQTATENVLLTVNANASDSDGTAPPTLSQTNTLPGSPTFTDNGNGSATLTWTPPANSSGTYNVTVTATDSDGATDVKSFAVTVSTSNAPVITPIPDQTAIEDVLFNLQVEATDTDGPAPITITETNTLPGTPSILTDNGDGTALISYTPPTGTSLNSPFSVTITATDGTGSASTESFNLVVNREGSITHTLTDTPATLDLTTVGVADWIQWGRNSVTDVNRKDMPLSLLSSWTPVNSPNLSRHSNSLANYIWSNGTPVVTGNTSTGLRHFQAGRGLEFTAPAGVGLRQLNLYMSALGGATSRVTATLSDGSSDPLVVLINQGSRHSKQVALTYKASTPGATLTVRLEKVSGQSKWVALDAATLEEFNQAPLISALGDQILQEGQTLSLNVTATDPDGPAPITMTSNNTLPGNPTVFTDNGNGDGTITYTPAVGEAGNYTLTVNAADGLGVVGSQTININVVANAAPVLAAIGDQSTIAQQTLALVFQATDDGPSPLTITQTNTLPNAPAFTDNGDGTANFSWTPNAGASGSFTVTVTATDGDSMSATETFSIAVTASNPPVVTPITNQSIIEGRLLSFNVSANDADGNGTLSLAATPNTVPGLTFTDNGNGSGTVTMVPPIGSAGIYNLTITATDTGGDSDSESFSITVAANQPPTLTAIADQTATENVLLTVNANASDSDGTAPPTLSQTNTLPGSPTFTDNGNGSATLTWTPPANSSGTYNVTVTATDSDGATDVKSFAVTVSTSNAPVITPIPDQTAIEDVLFNLQINVSDPDGPSPLSISESNTLPGSPSILTDNGDSTALISYTPAIGESLNGPYTVTITATDGAGVSATESFNLTINREGAISATNEAAPETLNMTTEGVADWIHWARLNANSIDRKSLTTPLITSWNAIGSPFNATRQGALRPTMSWSDGDPQVTANVVRFGVRNAVNGGGFEFTAPASLGTRELRVYVSGRNTQGRLTAELSDGSAAPFVETFIFPGTRHRVFTLSYKSSLPDQTLTVRWEKVANGGWIALRGATLQVFNDAPDLTVIGDQSVIEGRPLALNISATDTDGPAPLVIAQSNTLPGNPSVLTDNGDGTAALNWTPAIGDAANGPFSITITATDGELAQSSETFQVLVAENGNPVLANIPDQDLLENQTMSLNLSAIDLDGPAPMTFSATSDLPGSPALTDNGDGSATYVWPVSAGATANSPYSVTITVDDADNGTTSQTFAVRVTQSLPPNLNAISNVAVIEGRLVSFPLTATDLDGPLPLVFSGNQNMPSAPTIVDNGDGTGSWSWVPAAGSAGVYNASVTVTDNNGNGTADTESFTVTVAPNQLPTLGGDIGAQTIVETQTLNLTFTATDGDGPLPISIAQTNTLPRSVVFNDSGNGTATLSWVSIEGDASATPYNISLTATDGQGGTSTQNVSVTVNESAAPVFEQIADQNVVEGQLLNVTITTTDADGPGATTLTQTSTLPGASVSLTDNGDGTGTVSWQSALGDSAAGPYSVTLTATDAVGKSSTETFAVAVNLEGALSGSSVVAAVAQDLSELGSQDWVKWGLSGVTGMDRKFGVTPLIFNYTPLADATPQTFNSSWSRYSFDDGTPTASLDDFRNGLRSFNNGKGFEFTAAADTEERTLLIFVGQQSSTGTLTATLSDGSAAAYSAVLVQNTFKRTKIVTLTYKASLPGQTLTVQWTKDTGSGWISLEAAAMSGSLSLPFSDNFDAGGAAGWTPIADSGVLGNWNVVNGEYTQSNFVGFNGNALDGGYNKGTYSYLRSGASLGDHTVTVTANPMAASGEDFGIMTRVDPSTASYQRLSFSNAGGFTRLESKEAASWTTLARNARPPARGTQVALSMQLQGNVGIAWVDGEKLAGLYDANRSSGSVGLYCRDLCSFDDVVIDKLPATTSIAISSPMAYNVMTSNTFTVSAVVINKPTGGNAFFDIVGLTNACSAATELQPGYFTASCTAPGQGMYQISAAYQDGTNTVLDTHTIDGVGIGDSIVTFGDSITKGLDDRFDGDTSDSVGYVQNGQGYQPYASTLINSQPTFTPSVIHKEGVPGDTSALMLNSRLPALLERHSQSDELIVMVGVNDAGGATFTPSGVGCNGAGCNGTFKGNLQGIVDQANLSGITPLVPRSMPRFGDADSTPYPVPETNARNLLIRDEYNAVIGSEISGATIGPDFYDLFLGSENRFYLYATNLHPNALGYQVVANELSNSITGANDTVFFATDLCVKRSIGGACDAPLMYKQTLLEPGSRLWVDEVFELTGTIPAALTDGRWVQTTNNDRNLNLTDHLSMTIPSSSTVYVAYDASAFSTPAWLSSGYTNTGQSITTSNQLVPSMTLWASNSPVTGNISLPAANAAGNGASAHYVVIIVEQ